MRQFRDLKPQPIALDARQVESRGMIVQPRDLVASDRDEDMGSDTGVGVPQTGFGALSSTRTSASIVG